MINTQPKITKMFLLSLHGNRAERSESMITNKN